MSLVERIRAWTTAEHFAQLGIVALLLAVIRTPAEVLRLGAAAPVVGLMQGEIIGAAFCLAAVLLLFLRRPKLSVATAVVGVAVLIAFKFWQLPTLG
jgi:hypothetical protein